jgi:cytochrome c-type biogenesis protein CcmH
MTGTSPRKSAVPLAAGVLAAVVLAAVALAAAALVAGPFALATAQAATSTTPTPRASLTDIEGDVMCTSCREPLAVAQSPQADSERAYIRGLIAEGETKPQILQNLVAQYGTAVLGKPPAHGFNLTVYVIPVAILAVGAAVLAFTLPRWRRRTRAAAQAPAANVPGLDPEDAQRLDQELSQFRG